MSTVILPFGTAATGEDVHLYLLSNDRGMSVGVTDLGACLVSCHVPDGKGNFPDVTLGHSGAAGYLDNPFCLGAIVGRCANRIAGASFELSGTTYRLAANDGPNALHGGERAWHQRYWKVSDLSEESVTFELVSRKLDQGFPGSVQTHVTYRLSDTNQLMIYYSSLPSEATLINLTSHAYWNLNGHAAGSVLDHTLQIKANKYTPMGEGNIPTGEIASVEGTPYDFRQAHTLGERLEDLGEPGYDDNYCLDNGGKVTQVARLVGDKTGITMTISTDAPGMQVYTGQDFGGTPGKDGVSYGPFAGVALETQHYPDAIHHKDFPQPVYTPMRPFVSKTILSFGVRSSKG